VRHRSHAPFLVGKLWDFFITEPLPPATRKRLARVYVESHHRVAPVVREVLSSRALYAELDNPRMVKWPIVQIAGSLRMVRRGVDTDDWAWIVSMMGQMPFSPPSVAGWDWGPAWMSTATMRARFLCATWICKDPPVKVGKGTVDPKWTPAEQVERARAATGRPSTSSATDRELLRLARRFLSINVKPGAEVPQYQAELAQSALRHLLLSGPDACLC
jgi:uncharacterized protein (DUF1800 family)